MTKLNAVIEEVVDSSVVNYFNRHVEYFQHAEHFGRTSNIVPKKLPAVQNARIFLTKAFSGYRELPCGEVKKYFSLKDISGRTQATPCLVTFLDDLSREQMHNELNSLINQGMIKGIANGNLAAAFVRAKLFEAGKPTNSTLLIPLSFQKKISTAKVFFRGAVLSRKVDGTTCEWKFFSNEKVQRGMSVLAFR